MLSSMLDMAARKHESDGDGGQRGQRKARPDGDTLYIDESDRLRILARMDEMVPIKTKAQLARDCKVTPAAITLLLKEPIPTGGTRGCKYVPQLQKALGIVITTRTPAVVPDRLANRRAMTIQSALSPEDTELWLKFGERLASDKNAAKKR